MPLIKLSAVAIGLAAALLMTGCQPPESPDTRNADPSDQQPQELIPAKPGVAKQGQIIGDGGGPLTTPAAALFKTKQRVVFEIQIPYTMRLYEAEHGEKPKSHDAFMQDIVRQNQIALPELPEGHEYIYDPEQAQLMVRRPAENQVP